jgi:hypothetical protein
MRIAANFLVAPDVKLVMWTVLVVTGVVGSLITLAKGRMGWFVLDFVTLGLAGNLTAFLSPNPRSLWARRSGRRSR